MSTREMKRVAPGPLGLLPPGWRHRRNATIFHERDQRGDPTLPILQVSIQRGVQERIFSPEKVEQQAEDPATYKIARRGDIVFNKMRFWQGAVGIAPTDGLVSPDYTVAVPNDTVDTRFLFYLFKTDAYMGEVDLSSKGIVKDRNRLYWDQFKAIAAPMPPLDYQNVIADFLDRETAKTDALIAKQEELIRLVEEKRRAVIDHAVTKGLDPNAPMKDSGVPWIGEVPVGWIVLPLGRICMRIEQGWSPQCESRARDFEEWGVLKVGCVNGTRFDPAENKALPAELDPKPELEVRAGDLLMSRANTRELVGSVAIVGTGTERLLLCDKLYRLQLDPSRVASKYASYLLSSRVGRTTIEMEATGASPSMQNISQEAVKKLPIVLPPYRDQLLIQQHLDANETLAVRLGESHQRATSLLRERRTALITAAVTGQLDIAQNLAAEAA